jgi:hypothetical protein
MTARDSSSSIAAMQIADWKEAAAYRRLMAGDGAAWAWEFLRRNPQYQAEWQAFMDVWNELEARYGSPPNRDFCAWKNDPRAWVPADECDGDCRVDHDKVLIECAMGARWGFHKFPPDPRDDSAVPEHRIGWRERPDDPLSVDFDRPLPCQTDTQALLCFDLDLPLKPQFERAKRELQMLQRQRVRQGMPMRSVRRMATEWVEQVRVLDALLAGVPSAELQNAFTDETVKAALAMRDGGYLDLPSLPVGQ